MYCGQLHCACRQGEMGVVFRYQAIGNAIQACNTVSCARRLSDVVWVP